MLLCGCAPSNRVLSAFSSHPVTHASSRWLGRRLHVNKTACELSCLIYAWNLAQVLVLACSFTRYFSGLLEAKHSNGVLCLEWLLLDNMLVGTCTSKLCPVYLISLFISVVDCCKFIVGVNDLCSHNLAFVWMGAHAVCSDTVLMCLLYITFRLLIIKKVVW